MRREAAWLRCILLTALSLIIVWADSLFGQHQELPQAATPPSSICTVVSGLPPPGKQVSFDVQPEIAGLNFGPVPVGSSAPDQQICISTSSPAVFSVTSADNSQFPVRGGQSTFNVSDYQLVNIGFAPAIAKKLGAYISVALITVIPSSGTTQAIQANGEGTLPSTSPVISSVLNAATFQTTMAAGSYIAITGQNLSTNATGRTWTSADFTRNADQTLSAPTSLDGTSVTVNGLPAYVEYVSPTQINAIVPATGSTGNGIPVVVTVNGPSSTPFNITLENLAPSFFAWSAGNSRYLVAQHSDYSNVGPVGLFPNAPANFTTTAKPGETITLYGSGFGLTSPPVAAGIETDKIYNLSPTPTATLGGIAARVAFAGLIPGLTQVYQVNLTVPSNIGDGDQSLVLNLNGTLSYPGLITVQQ